ncbi:low molecular weight protein arginine phosphatase [Salisediminibacterium selenitireducens]|uniref:Protein tyrosine phosphatase n=1 Tax=Bacillus selenitireducens (strain ATCC 700615 / DSM 15326 / MLS10) TaxID=439292 RepID=D6Y0T4_BACIE|nr:low molecular weight protein arginine phosphatase [Salisediminibacterium selenitireducens]ADI00652.1 protein tyrosine phosphatase [[Bacillus] selenitireducens MLS10]
MTKVLFICTGNTCRSPMAEALLEHKKTDEDIVADSAGLHGVEGMPMSEGTRRVLQTRGIMESHQSRVLDEGQLRSADLVLTMTEHHKRSLIEHYPEAVDKVYTLKEYTADHSEMSQKMDQIKQEEAEMDLKRSEILNANERNVRAYNKDGEISGQTELEEELLDALMPYQSNIDKLKWDMPSLDIADPFGGGDEEYEAAYEEINHAVEQLLKKIERN